MKILLIQPIVFPPLSSFGKLVYNHFKKISFIHSFLTLQQVAAVTPKEHDVKLVDERVDKIPYDEKNDVVGITVLTPYSIRAYEIADEFRKRGVKVVLGGYHPTALPEEAKEHADAVVIGEAELTWPELLRDLENDELKPFYKATQLVDPKLIPPARRDIVNHIHLIGVLQATRGCPYACGFCAVSKMEGRTIRKRPIENVISEMKAMKQKYFFFADASMTIDPNYTKELFRAMKGLRKRFACFGNAGVLGSDDELLSLAKKAGNVCWNVGFESISQETIDNLGKRTNKVQNYKDVVKKIHKNKMLVTGEFIFGFEEDTTESFKKTLKMINEIKVDQAEINILTPLPGTDFYQKLESENRFLNKNWEKYYAGNVVFKPNKLSIDELLEGYKKITTNMYTSRRYLKFMIKSLRFGTSTFMWSLQSNFLWPF